MAFSARTIIVLGLIGLGSISSIGCADFHSFWGRRSLEDDVKAMEDPIFADERRAGIAGIQRRDELKQAPYQERFRQIARVDEAPAVRAQAVRALNQGRDPQAAPVYLAAMNDPEAKVRLEAVKALRHAPDDRAIQSLVNLANSDDQDRDVRIWATTALGLYPRLDVARGLVSLIGTADFSVANEARMSLRRLTGKDFHYDQGLWLRYLTSTPTPLLAKPIPPK